jgi:ketosteroid isomerase-like protein
VIDPRFRLIGIAVALAAGIAVLSAQSATSASAGSISADSAAVLRVVHDYHTALETGDSVKALSLLSDDAVVLESGSVESRAEYRSHHLPEDIKFAKAVPSKRSDISIAVTGSTAWTAGSSTSQGTFNDRAINSTGAESMVLSKTANGWKIRQIHWSSRTKRP